MIRGFHGRPQQDRLLDQAEHLDRLDDRPRSGGFCTAGFRRRPRHTRHPASADGKYGLYCAVIVKQVDAKTRAKTSINELLRGE